MNPDWQIVDTGCVFISFFLFLLLLGKRKKSIADRLLAFWLFFAVIHQAWIAWYALDKAPEMPQLIGWEMPFPFLHGPFLYLYILFLTHPQRWRRKYGLHFVPALLCAFSLIPVLISIPPGERLQEQSWRHLAWYFDCLNIAIILSGLVYITFSLLLLRRHKQNIAGQFSNTEKITLNWLRYLIGGMSVIWLIVIFYRDIQLLYLSVALFIFFIGYFGIRQVGIFVQRAADASAPAPVAAIVTTEAGTPAAIAEPDKNVKVKYERTGLSEPEALALQQALHLLMEEQQLYKDPELTIAELAKALGVHAAILSQVINAQEQMSFYDYINALRIAAFKRLALQPGSQQYTLLSLAFECGFNSKSSFNRNFRKATGLSPSDYLKEQRAYAVTTGIKGPDLN
ncbi:helix-turn-helix domain-containing protein [Taibaiella koreensis]|uniref:helix-turn-helix domain-containing protein n=1 Tax=Taibaiella koreensis TaxID=1268548 RepID=UPI000E599885|nr:helix-turn-helix domain-containing protein [Taibaiella koreensis]